MRVVATVTRAGKTTRETRFYAASETPGTRTPRQWGELVRGHWAGVEIRNHWVRDHCHREDGARSRNPRLVANLILLRSALLATLDDHRPAGMSRPVQLDHLAANPSLALKLLRSKV